VKLSSRKVVIIDYKKNDYLRTYPTKSSISTLHFFLSELKI